MRIDARFLARIMAEELELRLGTVREFAGAEKPSKKGKKGSPKKPKVASADSDADGPGDNDPLAPGDPTVDQSGDPGKPSVDGSQPDPEAEEDDDEDDDEADAVDPEGDGGSEPSGAVNDEISGKTIQAITIEPKSTVLPGAKEVVIATNESTDALRILITQTGQVKFFWRGQLHDIP